MKIGDTVEHKSKVSTSGYPHDKIYFIMDIGCRMKDPTTREWVDAVIYDDEASNRYVRELNDFIDKFQIVEEL